jgi:hypothetical protein
VKEWEEKWKKEEKREALIYLIKVSLELVTISVSLHK